VVAVGPFCVPCGKRFAKQSVYDAHLAGKKHLAALQRMGRAEEAMVCQLDVEAKRRKLAEHEAKRRAEQTQHAAAADVRVEQENAEAAAARRAEREEKLRQRAMLPMPACVTATSVYDEGREGDEEAPPPSSNEAAVVAPSSATASTAVTAPTAAVPTMDAVAGSGVGASFSYTSGNQDGEAGRVNRHTTNEMAAAHRALAQPSADWFNPNPATETERAPPPCAP
jgi:hypothetical protein